MQVSPPNDRAFPVVWRLRQGSATGTILDLLDLTHIESGKKSRELSDVDVREITQLAMETSLPAAREKQIDVRLHADQPVLMRADRGEIEIIMNNLVTNSIKYNRSGGSVAGALGSTPP